MDWLMGMIVGGLIVGYINHIMNPCKHGNTEVVIRCKDCGHIINDRIEADNRASREELT